VPIACLLAWPERAVCQQWKMAVGILCVSCSGQHIGCNWLLKKRIFLYLVEKKLAVWKARSHGNFRNTMFKVGQKLTRQEWLIRLFFDMHCRAPRACCFAGVAELGGWDVHLIPHTTPLTTQHTFSPFSISPFLHGRRSSSSPSVWQPPRHQKDIHPESVEGGV
jgi:hypothetical protein